MVVLAHAGKGHRGDPHHQDADDRHHAAPRHADRHHHDHHTGRKIAIYAAVTLSILAGVLILGLVFLPDDGSDWRATFSKGGQSSRTAMNGIGQVSLGHSPEDIQALSKQPYFGRTPDGRMMAEGVLDNGIYSVFFSPDSSGRRAEQLRFSKTFEGKTGDEVLKDQQAILGPPSKGECSRLLAHQGRKHCFYSWKRSDGATASMNLRSVSPTIGAPRTEMILTLKAPPPKSQ